MIEQGDDNIYDLQPRVNGMKRTDQLVAVTNRRRGYTSTGEMKPSVATLVLLLFFAVTVFAENDLAGLWKAKKRFGPDARGTLVLQRSGGYWSADMAGRTLPVTKTNGEIAFTLTNGGMFRGKLNRQGAIRGSWWRFGSQVNASPVVLNPDGENRWRGEVDPGDDEFTFYLLMQPQAGGSLHALLRNPEFDLGTQQGVERLMRDGNTLTLAGKRGGKERNVAAGTYDAERKTFTLLFPDRGGSYDFVRDNDDSGFYPRGKNPGHYTYRPPIAFDDGWPVSTLDAENIDRATIEKFVQGILEPGDDKHAPVVEREYKSPYGRSADGSRVKPR